MTQTHGLTEEELAALSPAEREAIEADLSESEAHLAAGGAGVSADADPFAKPQTEMVDFDAGKPAGDGKPAAEAKPDAPAGDDKAAKPGEGEPPAGDAPGAEASGEREPVVVPFQAPAVDPAKVKAALDELTTKFDAGDITLAEMLEQRDAINAQVTEARVAAKHGAQVELRLWEEEVDRFLEANPAYKDTVLYQTLDTMVKSIASDEANKNLTNRKILEKAHEELSKRFKIGEAAPAADPKKALEQKRKPDLSDAPPSLAGVPPAAPASVEGDEFAHIEALQRKAESGDADAQANLERALARLTPEQQDRYLQSA